MGLKALEYDGCPCDIYHLLWKRGNMTLKEIYDYLKPLYGQSSIRRSLYGLRDAKAIYKIAPDIWCFNKKKKPLKITTN